MATISQRFVLRCTIGDWLDFTLCHIMSSYRARFETIDRRSAGIIQCSRPLAVINGRLECFKYVATEITRRALREMLISRHRRSGASWRMRLKSATLIPRKIHQLRPFQNLQWL